MESSDATAPYAISVPGIARPYARSVPGTSLPPSFAPSTIRYVRTRRRCRQAGRYGMRVDATLGQYRATRSSPVGR
eukprot:714516-Rhodomonas_salina.3